MREGLSHSALRGLASARTSMGTYPLSGAQPGRCEESAETRDLRLWDSPCWRLASAHDRACVCPHSWCRVVVGKGALQGPR